MNLDYYRQLVEDAKSEFTPESRIPQKIDPAIRQKAAQRLTNLMQSKRPFSFLRLGDMELGLLLCSQEGRENNWANSEKNDIVSSTAAWGHPGLSLEEAPRLKRAYENATYVDFHERWWVNRALNPMLRLDRSAAALKNSGVSDSHLFMDWARYQLKSYCSHRRILFGGAEAGILQELWRMPEYRRIIVDHIPENADIVFLPITDRVKGRIDEVKNRVLAAVRESSSDTLFLSLGGAAKIICAEVATETNTCCFDFGGIMRGLTYSGADGQNLNRSTHHPFFVRVPFNIYMDAFEAAFPTFRGLELLVKAQIQVMLDATVHVYGDSLPTTAMDFSPEAKANFKESLSQYKRRYRSLEQKNDETRALASEFRKHLAQQRRPAFVAKSLKRLRNLVAKCTVRFTKKTLPK